mgnify:CR=1 FL=1
MRRDPDKVAAAEGPPGSVLGPARGALREHGAGLRFVFHFILLDANRFALVKKIVFFDAFYVFYRCRQDLMKVYQSPKLTEMSITR